MHLNGLRIRELPVQSIEYSTKSHWHLHLLQGTRCNDLEILLLFKYVLLYHDLHVNQVAYSLPHSVPVPRLLPCSSSPCRPSPSSHSCHIVPRAPSFLAILPRLPCCFLRQKYVVVLFESLALVTKYEKRQTHTCSWK